MKLFLVVNVRKHFIEKVNWLAMSKEYMRSLQKLNAIYVKKHFQQKTI